MALGMLASGRRNRPYQRRRRRPVAIVVSVLAAVALVTWSVILINGAGPAGTASCPGPASGPAPGEVLASDALTDVAPVAPSAIRVRVLNGGGQRGQANLVAAQLGDLGFGESAPPDNDPIYPDGDMECSGQLRFGPAGEAAASTLSLVLPCTELMRDGRPDDSVDVAVGTAFADVNPIRAAKDALDQLAGPAPGSSGADPNTPTAAVDPALLKAAHDVSC